MLRRVFVLAVGLVAGLSSPVLGQSPLAGRWEGAITIMGRELAIVVALAGDAGAMKGTIDIPQQGASGIELRNVRIEGQKVYFELPAGPGLAVFDGQVQGDRVAGTFKQGGMNGTFELKKGAAAQEALPPYKQEEVKVLHDGVTLAGTLTLPPGGGPHPVVVLITGSGAQNRDEDVFGFGVFRTLADRLTRAGYAVLRCDDRGVGGSTGSTPDSTSTDFAEDVLAEVKFLKARPDIDKTRIGLLGHSEGGLVAPLVATRSTDIAFIVLMSGPAVRGEDIMIAQADRMGRAEGRSVEQVRANAELQRLLFETARRNAGWAEALTAVKTATRKAIDELPEAQRKAIPDVDRLVNMQADAQLAFVRSRWFRFFLDYDPAPVLGRVNCPVLALFGEHDLQVPAEANRAVMNDIATKNPSAWTVKVIPGANHLYQLAVTGSATEYPRLKKEFAPGFVETLLDWLGRHTRG